jgi:hypothetical protein
MICLRWVRGLRDARAGGEGRWIRVRVAYNMKGARVAVESTKHNNLATLI